MGVRRIKDLEPKTRLLYKKLLYYKKKAVNSKKALQTAKQFSKTKLYNSMLQDVNSDTFNFIISQLKLQKYKPKGRRFTMQDKVFGLSLYKQSPKGYRLLSKIFCLYPRGKP